MCKEEPVSSFSMHTFCRNLGARKFTKKCARKSLYQAFQCIPFDATWVLENLPKNVQM
jgi:hypothetical protein